MTAKKTTKRTKKKTQTPLDKAFTNLMLEVAASPIEDKAELVERIAIQVANEPVGRKRVLSREVAEKTRDTILEDLHCPDLPAISSNEITELIQLQDVWYKDGTVSTKLGAPLVIGADTVDFVNINNLKVKDFIKLDLEPKELVYKGSSLPELLTIVPLIIGCTEDEAGELGTADLTRIWGLFISFFLGR